MRPGIPVEARMHAGNLKTQDASLRRRLVRRPGMDTATAVSERGGSPAVL